MLARRSPSTPTLPLCGYPTHSPRSCLIALVPRAHPLPTLTWGSTASITASATPSPATTPSALARNVAVAWVSGEMLRQQRTGAGKERERVSVRSV